MTVFGGVPRRRSARSSSNPAAPPPDRPSSPKISPVHALEDPALPYRQARQPAVVGALEQALRGEADPGQHLRRAAVAAPEAAIAAIELVIGLAGLRGPGADAALGAADLDHVGMSSLLAIRQ